MSFRVKLQKGLKNTKPIYVTVDGFSAIFYANIAVDEKVKNQKLNM